MNKKLKKGLEKYVNKENLFKVREAGHISSFDWTTGELTVYFEKEPTKEKHTSAIGDSITAQATREPNKQELLEKAKRDYPDGTILKIGIGANEGLECVSGEVVGYKYNSYDNSIDSLNGEGLYFYNGKWAEIEKKPVIKVDNKHLHEVDEYWTLRENYQLTYNKCEGTQMIKDPAVIERFLTKQAALDYVMVEAKDRFKKGCKVNMHDHVYDFTKLFFSENFQPKGNKALFISYAVPVWTEDKGFIATPIKEKPLMLGDCEVSITKQFEEGWGSTIPKTLIKANGGQVTKEEWLAWADFLNRAFKYILHTPVIESNLVGYSTCFYKSLNAGKIGCITHVTKEQIQQVTDRLNEM